MAERRSEPYLSTYLHRKGARLGLPIAGNFELTARCNFNCPMCYVHLSREDVEARGKELAAAQWIDIARQAKEQGMIFVLLTGGEPFVREDFFEIYGEMKKMGLLVSINSNGSMLSGEIRRKLIEDPPFRINVSLYGGSEETYRRMCGPGAFDDVIENIRAVKAAGIDVRLNVSLTQYNRDDLPKIYELSKELGVHMKATGYMYPSIRVNGEKYGCGNRMTAVEAAHCNVSWDTLRFTPEEFAQRAESMKNLSFEAESECSVDVDEGVSCRAGSTSFWLTWDGRMLPCGMMPRPTVYPLDVGFSAAWEEIRRATREIRMPSKCSTCPVRKMCCVCAAVTVTETGEFDGVPEYVCEMTHESVRKTIEISSERKNNNDIS